MCKQLCQGFDVVWGVCLSQMPWKTLGAHARSCKSGDPWFLLITCGISSRLIEVSAYCCHIPLHQQSGVWKICTQQKGKGGGADERLSKPHIFCWTSEALPSSRRLQNKEVRWRQFAVESGADSHIRQSALMCIVYRLCVCVWVYTNQYKPRNTICTVFTLQSCGRKITISNLMSFSCSMQS